jgi:serine/threonine-protein kinase RsbW
MGEQPMPAATGDGTVVEVHELPFARETNRLARMLLAAFMLRQQLGTQTAQDAAIVIGELVANGLDHGRPDLRRGLEVSWSVEDDQLRLSVLDGGGHTTPHVLAPDLYAARGRGLAMVEALSSSWWFESANGTRVTAVLPLG